MCEDVNINFEENIQIKEELHSEISVKSELSSDEEDIWQPELLEEIKSETELTSKTNLKCDQCNYRTTRKQRLKIHQKRHGLPFECNLCGNKFKYLRSLRKHEQFHKVVKNDNKQCKICFEQFCGKRSFNLHMSKNHPLQFNCNKCDFVTTTETKLRNHAGLNHSDTTYDCTECGKQFKWHNSLKKHMEVHQGTKNVCQFCNKVFPLKKDLTAHIKRLHSGVMLECTECDYKIPEMNCMLIHMNNKHKKSDIAIDGIYNCRLCSQSFVDLLLLREHKIQHSIFTCDLCGFLCASVYKLTKHMRSHNRNPPDIKRSCKWCNFETPYVKELQSHECTAYINCQYCNYRTKKSINLTEHVRKNHLVNRYTCELCEKTFQKPELLFKHIDKYHNEKKYQCLKCLESHESNEELILHKKNCKRLKVRINCSRCDYNVTTMPLFIKHVIRNHEGVKDFQCTVCNEEFYTQNCLDSHTRWFHIEKNFQCKCCLRFYPSIQSLSYHKARCNPIVKEEPLETEFVVCEIIKEKS